MSPAQKRTASEPITALLGFQETPQHLTGRPLSTSLGAVLVFLRGVSGALFLSVVIAMWSEIRPALDAEGIDPDAAYALIIGVSGLTVCALLVFAWFIWRGSNFARIAVMTWVMFSTITAAVGYFQLGEQITVQTSLVLVALDVLVLLALSSRGSRAWSRLSRQQRRALSH